MSSPQERVAAVSKHLSREGKLLNGDVSIITGSGQGIGRAAAILFAKHGSKVVICDIDAKKAEEAVAEIKSFGGDAIACVGDVTDPKYPENVVKTTLEKYGKINHLVLNAGFTWDAMIHKMTDAQFQTMLDVHNVGPFRMVRAAADEMRKNNGEPRTVTFVSSTSARGNIGQMNYAAGKSGVLGMTKTVAKEWGSFGVRSNCIAFGLIDTRLTRAKETGDFVEVAGQKVAVGVPQRLRAESSGYAGIPLRRAGQVEDAAGAMLFLASPLSSYVTGHCLDVTGGVGV